MLLFRTTRLSSCSKVKPSDAPPSASIPAAPAVCSTFPQDLSFGVVRPIEIIRFATPQFQSQEDPKKIWTISGTKVAQNILIPIRTLHVPRQGTSSNKHP